MTVQASAGVRLRKEQSRRDEEIQLQSGGELLAQDVGKLLFERRLGLSEDAAFEKRSSGLLAQLLQCCGALGGIESVPVAAFVLQNFELCLFDGEQAWRR